MAPRGLSLWRGILKWNRDTVAALHHLRICCGPGEVAREQWVWLGHVYISVITSCQKSRLGYCKDVLKSPLCPPTVLPLDLHKAELGQCEGPELVRLWEIDCTCQCAYGGIIIHHISGSLFLFSLFTFSAPSVSSLLLCTSNHPSQTPTHLKAKSCWVCA